MAHRFTVSPRHVYLPIRAPSLLVVLSVVGLGVGCPCFAWGGCRVDVFFETRFLGYDRDCLEQCGMGKKPSLLGAPPLYSAAFHSPFFFSWFYAFKLILIPPLPFNLPGPACHCGRSRLPFSHFRINLTLLYGRHVIVACPSPFYSHVSVYFPYFVQTSSFLFLSILSSRSPYARRPPPWKIHK